MIFPKSQNVALYILLLIAGLLQFGFYSANGSFIVQTGKIILNESLSWAILGTYYLGFTLGCLVAPIFRKLNLQAFLSAIIGSSIFLIFIFTEDPLLLSLYRLIQGICAAFIFIWMEARIHAVSEDHTRARSMRSYMIVIFLGSIVSQISLLPFEHRVSVGFLIAAIAWALIGSIMLLTIGTEKSSRLGFDEFKNQRPQEEIIRILFEKLPAFIVAGCAGLAWTVLLNYFPFENYRSEISSHSIYSLITIFFFACIGILISPLMLRKFRAENLVWGYGVLISVSAAFLYIKDMGPMWWISVGLLSFIAFQLYPISSTLANFQLEEGDRVIVNAGLVLAFGFGSTMGPLLTGIAAPFGGMPIVIAFMIGSGVLVSATSRSKVAKS